MGWSHTYGADKADIIAELTRGYTGASGTTFKTLKHCARGNVLYAVTEMVREGKTDRFIAVYLLSKNRDVGWGYKAMDDGMHPYYYDCPIGYLDMCSPPMNKGAADYRAKVRAHHAVHGRKLSIGEMVKLSNGWTVEVVSLKPLKCKYAGTVYKFSRKSLVAMDVAA
jgi:hypothetical protein